MFHNINLILNSGRRRRKCFTFLLVNFGQEVEE